MFFKYNFKWMQILSKRPENKSKFVIYNYKQGKPITEQVAHNVSTLFIKTIFFRFCAWCDKEKLEHNECLFQTQCLSN